MKVTASNRLTEERVTASNGLAGRRDRASKCTDSLDAWEGGSQQTVAESCHGISRTLNEEMHDNKL